MYYQTITISNYYQKIEVITILYEIFTRILGIIIAAIALIIISKGITLELPEKYQSFFETWSFNPNQNPEGNSIIVYLNLFILLIITAFGICIALH